MSGQFDDPTLRLIEEHVRRLVERVGVASDVSVTCVVHSVAQPASSTGEELRINVETGSDGRLLIGANGTHLWALQHLIRCVLRRQLGQAIQATVDVNHYRQRREHTLTQLAQTTARRATLQGQTIILRPMRAADRRLIHTALAERSDVKTESTGDEPNRRVVVQPTFI